MPPQLPVCLNDTISIMIEIHMCACVCVYVYNNIIITDVSKK